MEAGPPQGWYEDPQDSSRLRWWDGAAWSEHSRERQAAAGGTGAVTEDDTDAEREAQKLLAMEVSPTPSTSDDDPTRKLLPWLIGGIVLLIALGATAIIVGNSSDDSELPAQTTPPLDPDGEAADGQAQEQVRAAQAAIETYATDNGGSYEGASAEALVELEPSLNGVSLTVDPAADNYTLSVASSSGNSFSITRDSAGSLTFTCADPARAACPASGFWG